MVLAYAETDRNKGNENVTEKEAISYKFCTGTVYRRTDEYLKSYNFRIGEELDIHAPKNICRKCPVSKTLITLKNFPRGPESRNLWELFLFHVMFLFVSAYH